MPFHTDDNTGEDLVGHTVVDPTGAKIGKIAEVVHDTETGRPMWAVVDLGKLKAQHYAPLMNAYKTTDDTLVIDIERRMIASAPKAARDHELTPELEEELRTYFATA